MDESIELTPKFIEENFNYFLSKRCIIFNEDVSDFQIESISMQIIKWNFEDQKIIKQKPKPIIIFINTSGGNVFPAINVIDVIQNSKTPVYSIVLGRCMSAGIPILLASHKRYAFLNSIFLIHDGYITLEGSATKQKDTMEFFEKMQNKVNCLLFQKTKITSDEFEKISRQELYMFSEEAQQKGIINNIIGKDIELTDIIKEF